MPKMTFFETPYYQKHVFGVPSISRQYFYNMINIFFVENKIYDIFCLTQDIEKRRLMSSSSLKELF